MVSQNPAAGLTNADQRITEDVEKFCFSISELYGHTFKPLLDVVLFTRSLSRVMGYRAQFALYGYYVFVAWLLRTISPPLSQMLAQEAGLSGSFRAAHQASPVSRHVSVLSIALSIAEVNLYGFLSESAGFPAFSIERQAKSIKLQSYDCLCRRRQYNLVAMKNAATAGHQRKKFLFNDPPSNLQTCNWSPNRSG